MNVLESPALTNFTRNPVSHSPMPQFLKPTQPGENYWIRTNDRRQWSDVVAANTDDISREFVDDSGRTLRASNRIAMSLPSNGEIVHCYLVDGSYYVETDIPATSSWPKIQFPEAE